MAGRSLQMVRYLTRRRPLIYSIPSHPELALSMRNKDQKRTLELFEAIACSEGGPSEVVLNNVIRFCQEVQDSQGAEKVISIVQEKLPHRDAELRNVLIKCQSTFGWYSEAWQEYCQLLAKGETIREGTLKVLLTCLIAKGEVEKVIELLKVMEKRTIAPDIVLGQSLLKMCVEKGDHGKNLFEAVMSLYKECEVLVERELTDLAEECLKRNWGTVSTTDARVIEGACSVCAQELESSCISQEECDHLRHYFDGLVNTELQSFGDGNKDMLEMDSFKQFVRYYGPFAAVIDGLNVSFRGRSRNNTLLKNLMETCSWVGQRLGSGLLILRAHFPRTAQRDTRQAISMEQIKDRLKEMNIHTFVTRNRVKDDLYTVYGCLNSGPEAYFVSNDLLGDILNEIPLKKRKLYIKWLRSRQVCFAKSGKKWHFEVPSGHSMRVQWTENGYHFPLQDSRSGSWLCLRRTHL